MMDRHSLVYQAMQIIARSENDQCSLAEAARRRTLSIETRLRDEGSRSAAERMVANRQSALRLAEEIVKITKEQNG